MDGDIPIDSGYKHNTSIIMVSYKVSAGKAYYFVLPPLVKKMAYIAVVKLTGNKFIIDKYSINQRLLSVIIFYQNQSLITVAVIKLPEIFVENILPIKRTI